MSITVGDNFSYQGGKPLDSRFQFASVADMKAYATASLYDGCLAYIPSSKKYYTYDSSNSVDTTTGKWRELETGGGGASSLSDLDDTIISSPSNGQVLGFNNQTSKWENKDIPDQTTDCFKASSSAVSALDDADSLPVRQDRSGSTYKNRIAWSNIKSILKTYFDTIYSTVTAGTGLTKTNNTMSIKEFASGDMDEIMTPLPSSASKYMNYSTEEQVVGQWIDGKTVYQKTFTGTSSATSGGNVTLGSISSYSKIIRCSGSVDLNNNMWAEIPYTQDGTTGLCLPYISGNNVNVLVKGTDYISRPLYVTVQYTKS